MLTHNNTLTCDLWPSVSSVTCHDPLPHPFSIIFDEGVWNIWNPAAKIIHLGYFMSFPAGVCSQTHCVVSREHLGHASSDALRGGTGSQDPAWGPTFRKGVVLRTHCATLHEDKGRKERKWCNRPAPVTLVVLWNLIRVVSTHSNTLILHLYISTAQNFKLLCLNLFSFLTKLLRKWCTVPLVVSSGTVWQHLSCFETPAGSWTTVTQLMHVCTVSHASNDLIVTARSKFTHTSTTKTVVLGFTLD